ncbi:DNA polymerase III PolC-type [Corynebacterium heidelbergense]|uniref:DNA polymerase III subunit epsilon n=2 Tax=Corynebacterium heidelbergense TaxID=2055947 RepID=A0A364VBG1_9CORY|nr:DNA polymerase III subunit epsilon [Corynebacterium heidelbergense]WCZ36873.1 DNA polymerase III PolC-type [Corynebacterium heidelbergense]
MSRVANKVWGMQPTHGEPGPSRFDPGHMLSFDLETTGKDPLQARIVTSALVTIKGRSRDDCELLADPGVEIPEEATKVHGISTEHAREHGQPHDEVLATTIQKIREAWAQGATLIVYNAAYDLTVLRALEPSFTVDGLVVDPYVLDRHYSKRRGKRTLGSVCEHYGVELANAHEATADAVAAARVAWKLARENPQVTQMSADELMLAQATWHYEEQTGLQEWFKRQGRDVDVDDYWPLRDK